MSLVKHRTMAFWTVLFLSLVVGSSSQCASKAKCVSSGGSCIAKNDPCNGEERIGKAFCKVSRKCKCCILPDPTTTSLPDPTTTTTTTTVNPSTTSSTSTSSTSTTSTTSTTTSSTTSTTTTTTTTEEELTTTEEQFMYNMLTDEDLSTEKDDKKNSNNPIGLSTVDRPSSSGVKTTTAKDEINPTANVDPANPVITGQATGTNGTNIAVVRGCLWEDRVLPEGTKWSWNCTIVHCINGTVIQIPDVKCCRLGTIMFEDGETWSWECSIIHCSNGKLEEAPDTKCCRWGSGLKPNGSKWLWNCFIITCQEGILKSSPDPTCQRPVHIQPISVSNRDKDKPSNGNKNTTGGFKNNSISKPSNSTSKPSNSTSKPSNSSSKIPSKSNSSSSKGTSKPNGVSFARPVYHHQPQIYLTMCLN